MKKKIAETLAFAFVVGFMKILLDIAFPFLLPFKHILGHFNIGALSFGWFDVLGYILFTAFGITIILALHSIINKKIE